MRSATRLVSRRRSPVDLNKVTPVRDRPMRSVVWSALSMQGNPFDFVEIGRAPSELQSRENLVCRLLLEKKKKNMPQLTCRLLTTGCNGETSHEKKGDHYGSQAVRLSCTFNPYLGYQVTRPRACSPLFCL